MSALSILLIALDTSTRLLEPVRTTVTNLVSPLYIIAETPYLLTDLAGETFSARSQLLEDNAQLQRRVLELSQISQQYLALKAENERMRALLGSQGRLPYEVLIAEVVGIVPNPATHQIIIDKGAAAGVRVGQAVLDADGLFGQVVEAGTFTSRVLLITDRDHAVPVRLNRNGVRGVAGGTGELNSLVLENVAISADIAEGDLVETSGLGGRFPPGYPVGTVTSVVVEATSAYAIVQVRPSAQLNRSDHVLVIFSPQHDQADGFAPAELIEAPDDGDAR